MLSFKEYRTFYLKYRKLVDQIKTIAELNDAQISAAYNKYERKFKIKEKEAKQLIKVYEGMTKMLERPLNEQDDSVARECRTSDEIKMDREVLVEKAWKEDDLTTTQLGIEKVTKSIAHFVIEKNKRYGDSALKPLRIFSKHIILNPQNENERAFNQMLTRLDDKLSRVKNAKGLKKNDIGDIIGYLILLCVNYGWLNFDDLID